MKNTTVSTWRQPFVRDRFTVLAYALLASFCYLQASPGPLVPFLHAEMHLNYTIDSLHMSGIALGMIVAGLLADRVSARWGRRLTLWGGASGLLVGALLLMFSHHPAISIFSMFVIGLLGTFLMVTVQASLSDHHGEHRATAITEANMIASLGAGLAPICLGGMILLGAGWRGMLFVPMVIVLLLALCFFRVPVPEARTFTRKREFSGRVKVPGAFWLYWLAMVMGVAAEWSVSFWGSGYLINVVGIERTSAATLMSLFFLAAVIGRFIGSHLTRRISVERLLLPVLIVAMLGFTLFWLGPSVPLHVIGLFVAGLGICNLFPFTFSASANRIPQYADLASARSALGGGLAIFCAPLVLGRLGDMVGLRSAYSVILGLFVLMGVFMVLAARVTVDRSSTMIVPPEDTLASDATMENGDLSVDPV
ncbi:MFS transporter [Dictyobacter aurantiacus]|uniref:Major facilitator superfamily (MFS) profile domain-containing protein n=1 Tax=Dictyobacter aurantiacus TaxID=1936993 RepID=A0A401ZP69_9CHLR|nr:MFS transporter [Dictyobacter aurantiacus]GCE08708.1 hypothetical protein KDAU_60370 [Dictyobacter aurantiacus]